MLMLSISPAASIRFVCVDLGEVPCLYSVAEVHLQGIPDFCYQPLLDIERVRIFAWRDKVPKMELNFSA